MSRKTVFWVVLIAYVAAMGIAAFAVWKGRNLRTLPVLETTTLTIPTLEDMEQGYAPEHAEEFLEAARDAIVAEKRFRLKEDVQDVGTAGDVITLDILRKLEQKGLHSIEVWDTRAVLAFCSQDLVLAEGLDLPNGTVLIAEGRKLDPDSLFRFLLASGLTLENVRNNVVQPRRVYVEGRGSIIGLNATAFIVGVNFIVLVILLYVILWKPVTQALDERAEAVRRNIDTAEERRRRAEELFHQRQEELKEARETREELRRKGEQEGQEERIRLVRQAQEEAARIRSRAEEEIEAERIAAREQLTSEIGSLSVALASAVLRKEVSEDDHRQLVEQFVASLQSEDAQRETR